VPPPVAEAFARPVGDNTSLQRPPDVPDIVLGPPPAPPWRDPAADVSLGPPAHEPEPLPAPTVSSNQRFTLRQALFERRLTLGSLIALIVVALVIGGGGAVAGVFFGSRTVISPP
jgi:hypothetical protein